MLYSQADDIVVYEIAVFLLGILAVVVLAVRKWKKLGPELFPTTGTVDETATVDPQKTQAARGEFAARLVARAREILEKEGTAPSLAAVEALRKLEASAETPVAVDALMTKALETAGVESLLVRSGGFYAYLVAIPNRHEHAHLLRRYAAFSGGWRRHFELVRGSLIASSGDFSAMAAIVFFLNPERKESTLQVSCCNANLMLIPATLAEGADLTAPGVTVLDTSMEFSSAA